MRLMLISICNVMYSKLLAEMASTVYKSYCSEFRKMYMDSMRPFMSSIVTSQDTYLHPNWELS